MNAREVFEQEWAMYRQRGIDRKGVWSHRKGKMDDSLSKFDGNVKPCDIRIFADMDRPFVALIAKSNGMSGWTIVPLSPFTVPASSREMLVGERVLQLWNRCVAAKSLVERSWIVDSIDEADLADVKARMEAVKASRIAAGTDSVAEYERAFLVTGGTFKPFVKHSEKRRAKIRWMRWGAWSIAAMLMICFAMNVIVDNASKALEVALIDCLKNPPPEVLNACMKSSRECANPAKSSTLCMERAKYALASETHRRCARSMPTTNLADSWTDHGTERYAEFSENEFHDPKSEPLSTFSLDVDTSSYALMRRYLMEQKCLPPKTSVRLEEYVNYFRYDYAQPTNGDPIAVNCELAECPWNKEHKLLRLGVQAKRIDSEKLPPCNLTFLIDKSGSMNCNGGMGLLKSGLNMLVDKLRNEDHVSIVTYASGTEVFLSSTPGSDKKKLHDAINSLEAGGCTYGAGGLQLAYEEAMRNFDKSANNRVILVTDGDFNVGISSPKELEDFIAAKRKSGIFLSVIGVGHGNYQDANMKKLANTGNGNYAYLDSVLEAKKVLTTEFGGTLFTVAKDVKVQIEFNPSQVAGYRLLGYENRMLKAKDFNDDKKDAGEIGSGHSMTAFYEIVPSDAGKSVGSVDPLKYQKRTDVASDEMFTLKMRWKEPDGDASKRRDVALRAADITRPTPSEDFRFASAVAEFALVLADSKFKEDASIKNAIERARKAKGADEEGYRAEFIRLAELAELLQKE